MPFQIHDGAIPFLPNAFLVAQLFRKSLTTENLRMHAHDQHFFVIGAIEDTDPPAFRKPPRRAPEKIVFQFVGARLFETGDVAASWIYAGHDVSDGAVFSGRVHPLKN
jgi:hypothetical protein